MGRPLRRDHLPYGGCHLGGEPAQIVRLVAAEDDRTDAVGEGEVGEVLRPLLGRALERAAGRPEELPRDVEKPTDVAGGAARRLRGVVDHRVAGGEVAVLQVALRWQPAVGQPTGERQHPRLVRPEPDPDVVGRGRAALGTDHPILLAIDADPPRTSASQIARMTVIASSNACTASPTVRRRPPIASMASQKAPAPRPNSTRPPLSRSRLARAAGQHRGGRNGRFVTLADRRIVPVRARRS